MKKLITSTSTTFIYTIADENGKIRYIGKSDCPKKRLKCHIRDKETKHKYYWLKSIIEVGAYPTIEIIDEVLDIEWEYWEVFWISQFKQWGFNLINKTSGGRSSYVPTKRSKSRVGRFFKGKKLSEEHKQNISQGVIEKNLESPGYNNNGKKKIILDKDYLYDLYITKNLSMSKISELLNISQKVIHDNIINFNIMKDKSVWTKQMGDNHRKSVIQYDLSGNFIKEWESAREVKLTLNLWNVENCCRGIVKTVGGFIFRYKEEFATIEYSLEPNKRLSPVVQYDMDGNFIKEFKSMSLASKETNTKQCNIQDCCVGRLKSANNFLWVYKGDNPPIYKNTLMKKVIQLNINGKFVKEFKSMADGAKETHSKPGLIQYCCIGKIKSTNGFKWMYKLDYDKISNEIRYT